VGFVILILVLIVVGVICVFVWQASTRRKMSDAAHQLNDFQLTQEVMGEDGSTGLAVDETRRKICLIRNGPGSVDCQVVGYDKIVSSEIIENGSTVTKTSRASQIGGAMAGGILLGGVRAVVGGLTGSRTTKGKTRQLALRIIINDTARPTHQVNFLATECGQGGIVLQRCHG
jgi:hypothetical protein